MGDLPVEAITRGDRPFINVAIDFAAGLLIHQEGRGRRPMRGYALIIVCEATHAVHIELVSKLTTDAFIAALRRFIGRRGLCNSIFCDNGTNFVGADSEMKRWKRNLLDHEENIRDELLEGCIDFHFSPANSPHFNGLAEAAVKSMKHHLRRVLGQASLTYEEMTTLLVQIEAVMNSRPLAALSEDPNDLQVLTPAHFIIGGPLRTLVEPVEDSKADLHLRYRRLRQLSQHIWQRWSKEYLSQRQQRNKWTSQGNEMKPQQLVVIMDDNTRPHTWPVGRIQAIHPGEDGIVRVASVTAKNGILQRAVHRLCPLPVASAASYHGCCSASLKPVASRGAGC